MLFELFFYCVTVQTKNKSFMTFHSLDLLQRRFYQSICTVVCSVNNKGCEEEGIIGSSIAYCFFLASVPHVQHDYFSLFSNVVATSFAGPFNLPPLWGWGDEKLGNEVGVVPIHKMVTISHFFIFK